MRKWITIITLFLILGCSSPKLNFSDKVDATINNLQDTLDENQLDINFDERNVNENNLSVDYVIDNNHNEILGFSYNEDFEIEFVNLCFTYEAAFEESENDKFFSMIDSLLYSIGIPSDEIETTAKELFSNDFSKDEVYWEGTFDRRNYTFVWSTKDEQSGLLMLQISYR